MPCNTIQTNTVELEHIPNLDLLEKALLSEFEGGVVRRADRFIFTANGREVTIDAGRAYSTFPEKTLQMIVGRVKQAYSRTVVKEAVKRYGWSLEKGVDVNNFVVVKG